MQLQRSWRLHWRDSACTKSTKSLELVRGCASVKEDVLSMEERVNRMVITQETATHTKLADINILAEDLKKIHNNIDFLL